MKFRCRHLLALALALCAFCLCLSPAHAAEADAEMAEKLTGKAFFTGSTGFPGIECLYDGVGDWGLKTADTAKLSIASDKGIASLYIRFGRPYAVYSIIDNDTGTAHDWNQKFIHDYIDLEALFGYVPTSVTLSFQYGAAYLYEVTGYTKGQLPDDVQVWEEPKDGETDLVLFSTHCDDEHLFFAGILPYYAGELNYNVQLVYMTDHVKAISYVRVHESLDGLWKAGVRNYPIWGEYYDYPVDNIGDAYRYFKAYGWPEEEMLGFVVEQLRRFKPTVAVGHDLNGEYSHGQHMVWADLLAKAVQISGDESQYSDSSEKYGAWDVPKTYLHLYEENPVVMDWDKPLNAFGGKTAWQMSMEAYALHVSQHEDLDSADWYFVENETAASITREQYTPCQFGLYRSTVGDDAAKNDFFENTTTYAQLNGTATVIPTEPEPEPTEAPTEPAPTEAPVPETQPVEIPSDEPADEGAEQVTYPVWPFLVIGAAVVVAGVSLVVAKKEKTSEK